MKWDPEGGGRTRGCRTWSRPPGGGQLQTLARDPSPLPASHSVDQPRGRPRMGTHFPFLASEAETAWYRDGGRKEGKGWVSSRSSPLISSPPPPRRRLEDSPWGTCDVWSRDVGEGGVSARGYGGSERVRTERGRKEDERWRRKQGQRVIRPKGPPVAAATTDASALPSISAQRKTGHYLETLDEGRPPRQIGRQSMEGESKAGLGDRVEHANGGEVGG